MTAPPWAEDSWHMCFEAVGDRPPYGECALVRGHDGPHLDRPRPYRGWDVDPLTVEPVDGWETARHRAVDRPVVDRGAIVWTTSAFLVLIAIVWFIATNLLSAPRSEPQPTTPGPSDLSSAPVGASGPSSSGAPTGRSGAPLAAPQAAQLGTVLEAGGLNQAKRSHGDRYLAIRAPRGTAVRVCGPVKCVVMTSTDYGPQRGTGKVADVALVVWRDICGLPDIAGVCQGSIEYPWRGATPTLPPTDTEEMP